MQRLFVVLALLAAVFVASCSDSPPPPEPTPTSTTADAAVSAPPAEGANVMHAKLNANGVPAHYSAHFDQDTLVRIDERRQPTAATTLAGEYIYQGARLMSYRGARISEADTLELQFDAQGVVQSGRGPGITDEEIAAIRNRAQLLRSHALAQRASRGHSMH